VNSTKMTREVINYKGMQYAPEGEIGVVYLFSKMQRELGYKNIVRIGDSFPDCEALKITGKRARIEFEFRAGNFLNHHKPNSVKLKAVDLIICWEDNWPPRKRRLLKKHRVEIMELRKRLGLGRNIWFHVVRKKYQEDYLGWLSKGSKTTTLPCHKSAKKGDLLLDYIGAPKSYIAGIELVASDAYPSKKKGDFPYRASVRRIATLKNPVHFSKMLSEKSLVGAFFLRPGGLTGVPRVTEYWPQISDLILRLNSKITPKLRKFTSWD